MTVGRKRKSKSKIYVADVARAARKLQEEKDGNHIISDHSAPALRHYALYFEDQYKEKKSRAGSASKKKEGIWKAVCEIRAASPDMGAEAVWNNLDSKQVTSRWTLEMDGDKLCQFDAETGKSRCIKFSTFQRHYYPKALIK